MLLHLIRLFLIVLNERMALDVTEYGNHIKNDDGTTKFEYVIRYDEGITSDHVIASAAFPVNFDYVNLNVQKHDISQGQLCNLG